MPIKTFANSWTVTMFSYTNELLDGRKSANALLEELLASGITKVVELDGPQHFRNYPDISAEELKQTKAILDKYDAKVSLLGIYADRVLSAKKLVEPNIVLDNLKKQLHIAHALGAPGARIMVGGLTNEELAELVPLAENLNVSIVYEVQGSSTPDSKAAQDCLSMVKQANSKNFGIVFDSSLFMTELPQALQDSMLQSGIPKEQVDEIARQWKSTSVEDFKDWLTKRIAEGMYPPVINSFLLTLFTRMGHSQPADWAEYLPYIQFVHLKYWELSDDNGKLSKPTKALGEFLDQIDYQGYYTCEWGGHEWGYLPECNAMDAIKYHKSIVEPILTS